MEPAKRALDAPAPLQDPKALGVPGAFHAREGPLPHRRDPLAERAGITPISPAQLQSWAANDQRRQDLFGPIAVLDPRRMHDDDQEQTEDIDHAVSLATTRPLTPIIATDPPCSVVFTV